MSFFCRNCNKTSQTRTQKKQNRCPMCGCHVFKSLGESANNIYRLDYFDNIDFNLEETTKDLIELIMPAVVDQTYLKKVIDNVKDYFFNKYERILNLCPLVRDYRLDRNKNHSYYRALIYPLQSTLERKLVEFIAYQNLKAQQLASAVRMYDARMSAPVQGLGFGIITNDLISAATYTALAKQNYKKQISRREAVATNELTMALSKFQSNDNSMSEKDMYIIFDAINETVKQIDMWLTTYRFIIEHKDFYTDEDKYNLHKCINGIDVHRFIADSVSMMNFYGNQDRDLESPAEVQLLDELEALGYIYRVRGYYFSTTKFENETLTEIYLREHPEERAALELKNAQTADQVYAEAEELLKNKQYYEAAIAFAKIPENRNAAIRSLDIWHDHLELFDVINKSNDIVWAIRDNGTIACTEKKFFDDKDNKPFIDSVRSINNAYTACWYLNQFRMLDINGNLQSSKNSIQCASYNPEADRIVGDCSIWKYLVDVVSNYDSILGLRRDGRVVVSGDSKYKLKDILEWKDIVKIKCGNFETYVGIRSDGSIAIAGDEDYSKLPYHDWRNIVDVALHSYCLIGLKTDGTIQAIPKDPTQKDNLKELASWKDIRRIRYDNSWCLGITSTGELRFFADKYYSSEKAFFESQKNVVDALYGVMGSESNNGCLVLHSDGTVTAKNIPIDLSEWKDIVSIGKGNQFVYGIKSNGKLVFAAREKTALALINEIKDWVIFEKINALSRNKDQLIRENSQTDLIKSKQELEEVNKTLEQTKGIFSLKKKRELKLQISKLKRRLYPECIRMSQGKSEVIKFNQ